MGRPTLYAGSIIPWDEINGERCAEHQRSSLFPDCGSNVTSDLVYVVIFPSIMGSIPLNREPKQPLPSSDSFLFGIYHRGRHRNHCTDRVPTVATLLSFPVCDSRSQALSVPRVTVFPPLHPIAGSLPF